MVQYLKQQYAFNRFYEATFPKFIKSSLLGFKVSRSLAPDVSGAKVGLL